MKYMLIFRKGDQEIIDSNIQLLEKYDDQRLIDRYNGQVDLGITGVHSQALFLYALEKVMKKRFKKSRILKKGTIIELKWKAELVNGKVRFKPKKTRHQLRQERRIHDSLNKSQPRIYYTRRRKLKISFLTLIIRVDSISKYYYGGLDAFAEQYELHGVSNKRLLIRSEMRGHYPSELDEVMNNVLIPLGFKDQLDYFIVQEQLISGVGGYDDQLLNKPIPDCKNISWLGSIMSEKGHFVWYRSSLKSSKTKQIPVANSSATGILNENNISASVPSLIKKSAHRLFIPFSDLFEKDFLLGCSPYLIITLIVLLVLLADNVKERVNPIKYYYRKYSDAVESKSETVSKAYNALASDSVELSSLIKDKTLNQRILTNDLKFGIIDSSDYLKQTGAIEERFKEEMDILEERFTLWNSMLKSGLEELSTSRDSLTKYKKLFNESKKL